MRVACLGVMVAAVAVTAPVRHERGGGWWSLMSAGVALSLLGALLAQVAETAGGIVALAGGLMVVAFAVLGFPLGERT